MKTILRFNWELTLVILDLIASGIAWFTYFYTKEINVLVMGIASLVCLVAILCSYKTISHTRKTLIRLW